MVVTELVILVVVKVMEELAVMVVILVIAEANVLAMDGDKKFPFRGGDGTAMFCLGGRGAVRPGLAQPKGFSPLGV